MSSTVAVRMTSILLLLFLSLALLLLTIPAVNAAGAVGIGGSQRPQVSRRIKDRAKAAIPPAALPPFVPLSRPLEALRGMPYPTPPLPATIFRYSPAHFSADDVFLLITLAGSLARHNSASSGANSSALWPLLYATTGTGKSDPEVFYWDQYTQRLPTVNFSLALDSAPATDVVTHFSQQGCITGAYLVALQTDSVDVCVSMAGITDGAICATSAHTALLQQLHIPVLADLRGVNETQFLDQFLGGDATAPWPFSTRFVTSEPLGPASTALSDWSILIGAVQVHLRDNYSRVMAFLRRYYPTPHFNGVFGWAPDGSGEEDLTGTASSNDAGVMASDWLKNGAVHASLVRAYSDLQCPSNSDPVEALDNRGKHTLALLFTDGDNLQANENNLLDRTHWAHPKRGSVPIGWGLNPTLASTFPVVLTSYYEQAVPANDAFVAFSAQYAFPDFMSDEGRQRWAEITGQAMAAADMRLLNYIARGMNAFNASIFAPLLNQWNIDAVPCHHADNKRSSRASTST